MRSKPGEERRILDSVKVRARGNATVGVLTMPRQVQHTEVPIQAGQEVVLESVEPADGEPYVEIHPVTEVSDAGGD